MFETLVYDGAVDGHAHTLLWSECALEGTPLDEDYLVEDIEIESRKAMDSEVIGWMDANEEIVRRYLASMSPTQLGHDLALTRNHHGAGFWDRGLGELGDELTDAAHLLGSISLTENNGELIAE